MFGLLVSLLLFFYPVNIVATRRGDTVDAFAIMMCQRCRSSIYFCSELSMVYVACFDERRTLTHSNVILYADGSPITLIIGGLRMEFVVGHWGEGN